MSKTHLFFVLSGVRVNIASALIFLRITKIGSGVKIERAQACRKKPPIWLSWNELWSCACVCVCSGISDCLSYPGGVRVISSFLCLSFLSLSFSLSLFLFISLALPRSLAQFVFHLPAAVSILLATVPCNSQKPFNGKSTDVIAYWSVADSAVLYNDKGHFMFYNRHNQIWLWPFFMCVRHAHVPFKCSLHDIYHLSLKLNARNIKKAMSRECLRSEWTRDCGGMNAMSDFINKRFFFQQKIEVSSLIVVFCFFGFFFFCLIISFNSLLALNFIRFLLLLLLSVEMKIKWSVSVQLRFLFTSIHIYS